MGIRFYLNVRNKRQRTEASVVLAALRGQSLVRVTTPFKVRPAEWNAKGQKLKASAPGATERNAALARLRADAEILLMDWPMDADLKAALRVRLGKAQPEVEAPLIRELFDRFKGEKAARCRPSTLQVYEALGAHLQEFAAGQQPADVGAGWLEELLAFLVGKGLQNSTTNKLLTRARGFLRWMVERGHLENLPSAKPLPTPQNFAVYLSTEELARLASLDLSTAQEGHRAARDLFVFGACTGQRYSDLQALRWEDLTLPPPPMDSKAVRAAGTSQRPLEGEGGYWNLSVKKTGQTVRVPLPTPALAVIEARRTQRTPLPRLSNQKANEYLKEVCRLAGIDAPVTVRSMRGGERLSVTRPKHEAISTHAARRTFVTLAMQAGLSMNELLGFTHQDLKSLRVYAGQDHARLTAAIHRTFDSLRLPSIEPIE